MRKERGAGSVFSFPLEQAKVWQELICIHGVVLQPDAKVQNYTIILYSTKFQLIASRPIFFKKIASYSGNDKK